jgi:acetyl-CoA carboxylase carboxyl transferase subunit alpha
MKHNMLDFEQPIADLESKIDELRALESSSDININDEIQRLRGKSEVLMKSIYADLSSWQVAQVARHPRRPHTREYIQLMLTDFDELHGDRNFGDDPAIIGGIGKLGDLSVMLIGHEKGQSVKEKVFRNFGMPKPEGYRKAMRLMKMAERFQLPVITLIDTPGAYPGIDAEERGQSEAIASSIQLMSDLKTPVIATVIGEGGSGGALAIGVCDHLLMLQYSTYSVISPEGCASILWKTADKAPDAAEAMGITAQRLLSLGLIDGILMEPAGGAHRAPEQMALTLKQALLAQLPPLMAQSKDDLIARRYQKLMAIGV